MRSPFTGRGQNKYRIYIDIEALVGRKIPLAIRPQEHSIDQDLIKCTEIEFSRCYFKDLSIQKKK